MLQTFFICKALAGHLKEIQRALRQSKGSQKGLNERSNGTQTAFKEHSKITRISLEVKLKGTPKADLRGARGCPPSPYFLQSPVFFNHFEELQTMLFEVELIINNAPLT